LTEIAFAFPLANGLHARPASLLQEACLPFAAAVIFRNDRNRRRADARSVLELVASDTLAGDPCALEVSGPDEKKAGRVLGDFVQTGLPRADNDLPPPAAAPSRAAGWLPPVFKDDRGRCWQGQALAPGVGRGRALLLEKAAALPLRFAAGKGNAKKELLLFQKACREVESDLHEKAAAIKDRNAAGILKAHLAILNDPGFRERIGSLIIKRKKAAGAAIHETAARFARILQRSRSVYLQERVGDLEDLAAQLGEKLYGRRGPRSRRNLPGPAVVVAASLTPSELLSLDRRHLLGLVLGQVGLTSHTAILARSLGIPAVSLPTPFPATISAGECLIVDGRRGLVCAGPGAALARYYRLEERKLLLRARQLTRMKNEPAVTLDGVRVEVAANIGRAEELPGAWRNGAEGIGLFRTETLFLERGSPPSEDEQFAAYRQAALSAKGRPVIIRTLDIGGDKQLPYLSLPQEENPNLGFRAVRFYAEQQDLILTQLRAVLRAARQGHLKVMVPMVSGLEEVRLVRSLLTEAAAQLRMRKIAHAETIELGIMVETPAAAFMLDRFAQEADFFSIGSNDLLQYFLAVDRGSAKVRELYAPLHPSFLRLLSHASNQARTAGRWLGICGEMASEPAFLPLLIGLGINELSMASGQIPMVKFRLRQLESRACRELLQRALCCATALEVDQMLRDFNGRNAAAEVTGPELICLRSRSRTAGEAIKELCDLMELSGRVSDASGLEEAVWKREQVYATDLGFGFALPHGKAEAVRTGSIAFLRPRRPLKWLGKNAEPVRAVLLIAIPASAKGEEHLKLIARLSRRLMHEDFRETLLAAGDEGTVLASIRACLAAG
jgi:phosphoenolpyruvate-protein phosphotransferase